MIMIVTGRNLLIEEKHVVIFLKEEVEVGVDWEVSKLP